MVAQKQGGATPPWDWTSGSDAKGGSITVTIDYDETTHALISLTSVNTSTLWTRLQIGLGGQTKNVTLPMGTRTFTAAQIAAATQLTNFDQLDGLNFTVAP